MPGSLSKWLILAGAAAPLLLTSLRSPVPGLEWWTATALVKIRPLDPMPDGAAKAVSIAAAKNEFEPFQIVLRAQSEQLSDVDVEVSDLKGKGNSSIPKRDIQIYMERFIDLQKPSSIEGKSGEWPDALVPRVDAYYGERRNAFPFTLNDGRSQPIWCEVYVPPTASAGIYQGSVTVSVGGKRLLTIPLKLEVWNFSLPSTSSFTNTFGFNGIAALYQHIGRYTNDEDLLRMTALYRKSALWHRISLHGGSMAPPSFTLQNGRMQIDWRNYDREVAPFLDGTSFTADQPLYGAKSTSAELRTSGGADTDELKVEYWREFAGHFRDKGWFDRLFDYLWDEPAPENEAALIRRAELVRQADPQIRNLVTAPLHSNWTNLVDIWTPLINCFESRAGFRDFCSPMADRAAYQAQIDRGKQLWWYQSCASHGCYMIGGGYFQGWPSYMIDITPVANRIMPWAAWKYDIQGELYFNTTEAYAKTKDAWLDVNQFGGNGDGTLFYPGTPARIGGTTHIPIESIRLKLIREGLEDYEYFNLLAKTGNWNLATDIADRIVHKTYDFEHDPAKLYEARRQMGEALSKRGGAETTRH